MAARAPVSPQDAPASSGDPSVFPTGRVASCAGWWAYTTLPLACFAAAADRHDIRAGAAGTVALAVSVVWHVELRRNGR